MAFCAKCGASLSDGASFCGSCGTPVAAGAATASSSMGAGGIGGSAPAAAAPMASNLAGCLAYTLTVLTGVLFLVLEPYTRDKFVRFHAFQAVFFGIACVAVSIAVSILSFVFGLIPLIGWIIGLLLWVGLFVGLFGGWILLMYKAYNNERYMFPVIGKIAAQQVP